MKKIVTLIIITTIGINGCSYFTSDQISESEKLRIEYQNIIQEIDSVLEEKIEYLVGTYIHY